MVEKAKCRIEIVYMRPYQGSVKTKQQSVICSLSLTFKLDIQYPCYQVFPEKTKWEEKIITWLRCTFQLVYKEAQRERNTFVSCWWMCLSLLILLLLLFADARHQFLPLQHVLKTSKTEMPKKDQQVLNILQESSGLLAPNWDCWDISLLKWAATRFLTSSMFTWCWLFYWIPIVEDI